MSVTLSSVVWRSALPARLKPLALCLADIANDNGEDIYASVAYIAWKAGLPERTIQRHVSHLLALGILHTENRRGGRGNRTEFWMDATKLPSRPPWAGERQHRRKGDTVAPIHADKRVPNETEKGAKSNTERVPNHAGSPPLILFSDPLDRSVSRSVALAAPPAMSPRRLMEIWNEHRGSLPECKSISPDRMRHAKARCADQPDEAMWITTVKAIASDPFCRGQNDRGWRADFDYLLRPNTWVKAAEGRYGPRGSPPPARGQPPLVKSGVPGPEETSAYLADMRRKREANGRAGGTSQPSRS